ncbi:HugZ family protein [Dechloromonas denitrificans]|uniref:HugZ family pyridoxamine 5'-phosphate oxidase n=1 Tax=Dechloromonas denitrificans TaxID=281362 RepID=UPI001CFC27C9|nr:pyridoxamine 5'-phosphate oxidase family protein [Dechloromonas denitrificans]UCV06145.1 pyridoxamine 5'-phosphate oxidase family protein [Dechloromonas denitrificans]
MQIAIASAIHLLHATPHAVLATHSTQLPGYPYATALPLVVDEAQRPLLLISSLAEHTKNLLADGRASLAVSETAPANIQNAARITLLGDFARCEPTAATVARYLRFQPDARQYLQLDFMFFRMQVKRARFIGGIGKMGWLDSADWDQPNSITAEQEEELLAAAAALAAPGIRLLGIDCYGVDYLSAGNRQRRRFAVALSPGELVKQLPDLVRRL